MPHLTAMSARKTGLKTVRLHIQAIFLIILALLLCPGPARSQTGTTIPGVQGLPIPVFYDLNQQVVIDATRGDYLQLITSFTDLLQDNNFNPAVVPGFDAPDDFSNLHTPEAKAALVSTGSVVLFQWAITADNRLGGRNVGDLAVYKFIPANINYGDRPNSGYVTFTMRTATADVTAADGQAWLTTQTDPNTVLGPGFTLVENQTYILWAVIQDDGPFDLDDVDGLIVDPPTISTASDGSDDGGDSGCVLRPGAGFGPEWLLLLASGGLLAWRGARQREARARR